MAPKQAKFQAPMGPWMKSVWPVASEAIFGQHEGVERPVQTQRHQEGVDHGDEDREDDRGVGVELEQGRSQAGADPHT